MQQLAGPVSSPHCQSIPFVVNCMHRCIVKSFLQAEIEVVGFLNNRCAGTISKSHLS